MQYGITPYAGAKRSSNLNRVVRDRILLGLRQSSDHPEGDLLGIAPPKLTQCRQGQGSSVWL